jgi:hypothetical protein
MTALLDRLNRWAENLPATDSIPISDGEAFDLAFEAAAGRSNLHGDKLDPERHAAIFDDILAGKFTFAGHRVVVL